MSMQTMPQATLVKPMAFWPAFGQLPTTIGMLYEDMCNIYRICIRLQYLPYIFVWPKN